MNFGAPIAIAFYALLVGGGLYGVSFDVRRWWDRHQWLRDQRRLLSSLLADERTESTIVYDREQS